MYSQKRRDKRQGFPGGVKVSEAYIGPDRGMKPVTRKTRRKRMSKRR